MTIRQMADAMNLQVFQGEKELDREISGGYVSDLLSDVMGHAREGEVWITLQSHANVVAIASLKDLAAIVMVKSIVPDDQVLKKAAEENIPVLGSPEGTFETAGKLFSLLR